MVMIAFNLPFPIVNGCVPRCMCVLLLRKLTCLAWPCLYPYPIKSMSRHECPCVTNKGKEDEVLYIWPCIDICFSKKGPRGHKCKTQAQLRNVIGPRSKITTSTSCRAHAAQLSAQAVVHLKSLEVDLINWEGPRPPQL